MILEGGENIKYNASTTIRMKPLEWNKGGGLIIAHAKVVQRDSTPISDDNTLAYLEMKSRECNPRQSSRFLYLIIKLRMLMIIKKHCV